MSRGPDAPTPAVDVARPRRSLLRKYIVSFIAVVGFPLAAYALISVWYAATEHRAAIVEIQRANAETAASRITQFIKEIEGQLRWATHLSWRDAGPQQRRIDALRLLRQVPAITDLTLLDGEGRERLFVSRVTIDRINDGADRSQHAAFKGARTDGVYYGPVHFRRDTEPFITIALAGTRPEAGVVIAEVNLKYTQDVVSRVQVGRAGSAYVVDAEGRLIAHPDVALVLRKTDLSELVQRMAAQPQDAVHRTNGVAGNPAVLAAVTARPLDWRVIVELPAAEADEPLQRALTRAFLIAAISLLVAMGFAALFSWRMVRPIRLLTAGAQRIGSGQLDHRIAIRSGDELEVLGTQFNTMAEDLGRSYATLERKVEQRTQALTEANQAKSRFLAAASHDLRQPLHALNLLVAQLRAEQGPQARERLTERIEDAVASINGLFDGLLDISKLDAGVVKANVVSLPLQRLLDRMESAFGADARAKGLRLRLRPCRAWVRSDPVLLERIVGNLVANALRYTRTGGVLIGCRRRGGVLQIEVRDTGIGIPPEKHREVFREFYQVAPEGHLRGEGLGLGLAIVARLCALLDHPIKLKSEPGRGSCFSVTVPLGQPVTEPTESDLAGVDPLIGNRVIVIDNDAVIVDSSVGLLASWRCEALGAASTAQALERLGERAPDVIIADMHLGHGEDGVSAIDALRSRYGHVPALLITGDVGPATRERAKAHGLVLLEKPVAPLKLRAAMTRLLQAARVTASKAASTPGE